MLESPSPSPIQTPPSQPKSFSLINKLFIVVLGFLVFLMLVAIISYVAFKPKTTVKKSSSSTSQNNAPNKIASAQVTISENGFSPATISVKLDQAVTWTNNDTTSHYVISDDPKPTDSSLPYLNSQAISPTSNYSYVFNKQGTYTYHDTTNPKFKGTVIVD
jgi:plastocyanin